MLFIFDFNSRFGLRSATTVVLPPQYDAIWPLPHGFWGVRVAEWFGVRTADGAAVCALVLPALYHGFAQLGLEEELEAFLEPEATFVPFMRQRFPALHLYYHHLCQPASWLAEAITPHLTDEEGDVCLPAPDGTLRLSANGQWHWLARPLASLANTLYYAPQPSAAFHAAAADEFVPADLEDLLDWRVRLLRIGEAADPFDAASVQQWELHNVRGRAAYVNALDELLVSSGICSLKPVEGVDIPFFRVFDLNALPAAVRQACETHIDTIFEVNDDSRVYVDQLIYLAWLWANGYVFYDPRTSMHWLDGRYEFDTDLFDNHLIDYIYQHHELDQLAPLLRELPPDAQ